MTLAGRPISGSSRAPAPTTTKSGWHVASLNSGVPHFGQKRRRITLPLSALLMYSVVEPEISRLLLAHMRLIEALPDDTYWQSLHQQARVETGGLSSWKRTAPQKHRPVMSCSMARITRNQISAT
jgi:hypothetical protein